MSLLPASCRDAPETVGMTSQKGWEDIPEGKMWRRSILLECRTKWDFKFKTIHLPPKNLPKFEIMIAFVNVLIDYNLMQNNSNVRRTVTSKWHIFVGLYLGKVKTPSPCKSPTMCLELESKCSAPLCQQQTLVPVTYPTPVQRPGQVVPCPQR